MNCEQRIKELEKQIEELNKECCKTYEPKPGEWVIYADGCIGKGGSPSFINDTTRIGRTYSSKETAKKARDIIAAHDIILKYVLDHDPGYEPDWKNSSVDKYRVQYNHQKELWETEYNQFLNYLTPYMPKRVAEKLVDDLNNNRINLYPFRKGE